MKTFKLYFIFLFFVISSQAVNAQTLEQSLNGNTALQANAPTIEQYQNENKDQQIQIDNEQNSIVAPTMRQTLTVNKLPDIKLNNAVIRNSVFTYDLTQDEKVPNSLFIAGYPQKAVEVFEVLDTPKELANAALLRLQMGEREKALPLIETALKYDNQNPLYQLLKVWILSASGKVKEAKKAYDDLLFLTADFEYLASGKLALAQLYFNKKDFDEAAVVLQDIYTNDPYKISHAMYLIARINLKNNSKKVAKTLFEQALIHDNSNYMAQLYLARTQQDTQEYISAWQSYASLYMLDPQNSEAKKALDKLQKNLKHSAEDYLFYNRLSEMFVKGAKNDNSEDLKIGLYSSRNGVLNDITTFTFASSSPYTIKDTVRGTTMKFDAFVGKQITFDKEQKGVHIQNKWGTYDYSTKNPFTIELDDKSLSMLIKDPLADDIFKANLSDKELLGTLLVIPTENGMNLVNISTIENTIAPLLTTSSRGIRNQTTLEVMAIALRTRLHNLVNITEFLPYDIPDNVEEFNFGGVNITSFLARNASNNTTGEILKDDKGVLASAKTYRACGSLAEEGIRNTDIMKSFEVSPLNLFKYMFSNPVADLYSAPKDPTAWSSIKWIYSFPYEDITARLEQNYKIGKLLRIEIADMSNTGRINSIRFVGKKDMVELPFDEANFVLSAGTLRSNFFTFIPFEDELLIIGTDTGKGAGLCIEGARGLAEQGKTAEEILKYYYPNYNLVK